MTLRMTLEIIPFGVESDAYVIEVVNISNVGRKMDPAYCNYIIEHNKYKTGQGPIIVHKRDKGALELVRASLEELLERLND